MQNRTSVKSENRFLCKIAIIFKRLKLIPLLYEIELYSICYNVCTKL